MPATIQFTMSDSAFFLLGLDDDALIAQVYPSLKHVKRTTYSVNASDARMLLDNITDRAAPHGGFEHSAAERRTLNHAAHALGRAIAGQHITSMTGR